MNSIYKKEYVDNKNPRFTYFKNLENYTFDYHYEIPRNGQLVIYDQPNESILPNYLETIANEIKKE